MKVRDTPRRRARRNKLETSMSSVLACVAPEDQELLNLRQQSPHPLPTPPALPRDWRPYVGGPRGYAFPWGYLIETPNGLKDPAAPNGEGTTWRLLPYAVWIEARERARKSRCDWSRVAQDLNGASTALFAEYVPDWLVCRVTAPCFLGEVIAVGECDAKRARCWLAGFLLTKYLDALLARYRDQLLGSIPAAFGVKYRAPIREVRP
jgi:hypothetical protein